MTTSWSERWASADWRAEAEAWVRTSLAGHGLTVTGPIKQPRIRFWSTQLTVPTDAGLFWFKENCPSLRAEAAVVAELVRIASDHVVAPLAVERDRGWMLSPDRGGTLAAQHSADVETWEFVFTQYADLQRRTVHESRALFGAGLARMRPVDVPDHVHEITEQFRTTPSGWPLYVDDEQAAGLHRVADELRQVVAELDAGPVPLALEHNDLHHNNAFVPRPGERTLRFFDFGDALWGHPFTSLFIPLNVVTREWRTSEDDPRVQRLVDAYLDRWSDLAEPRELLRLLELARPLGRIHRLETWRRVLTDATPAEAAEWAEPPRTWIAAILDHRAG